MQMSDAGQSNYKSKGGSGLSGISGGVSGTSGGSNNGRTNNDQYFQITNDIFTRKMIKLNDKKGISDTKNDNINRLTKPTDYNDAIINNCNGF